MVAIPENLLHLPKLFSLKHYLQSIINLLPFRVPAAYEWLEQIALLELPSCTLFPLTHLKYFITTFTFLYFLYYLQNFNFILTLQEWKTIILFGRSCQKFEGLRDLSRGLPSRYYKQHSYPFFESFLISNWYFSSSLLLFWARCPTKSLGWYLKDVF